MLEWNRELHHTERIGWLRAVVLGANKASFQLPAWYSALLPRKRHTVAY